MNWLIELFTEPTFIQAVLILSLISATGLALGKIKVFGVSLGVTFVFFAGIIAGHFGVSINKEMLALAQNFGLIIYIYSLGVQVGPGFFSSFKHGGIKLNLLALLLLISGSLMALILFWTTDMSVSDTVGLLSGAVTNTPMLGAGQQALLQIDPDNIEGANRMAMACAVAYPFGLVGLIITIIALRKILAPKNAAPAHDASSDNTYISEYQISNPAIFGKSILDIRKSADCQFVISRVWKNEKLIIPTSETILEEKEHILVISSKQDVEKIRLLFGHQENIDWNKKDIDWNAIDSQLVSSKVLVTKPEHNGVKLGDMRLRNSYGINITRVNRAGIDLLPSRNLRLQLGDKLTVVGEARAIENVSAILGNEAKRLTNPNLISIFTGIILGLVLGSIPIMLPGISTPIKLGIAGGPIIVGILMGAFGPRFHMATYTTRSANLMLRQMGLTIYLAGLGLSAGAGFFETVFTMEGLRWVLASIALAVVPVLITAFLAAKIFKTDYVENMGMICGSMANPFALEYASMGEDGEDPAVAYATVYPAGIFLRVISAQIIVLILS
jgi:AspT/YidE/YbjL antiporter-like protein